MTRPRIHLSHGTGEAGAVFHGLGLPFGITEQDIGWCPCIGRSRRAPNLWEPEKVWPDTVDAAWAVWLTDGVSSYHEGLVMLDQEGPRADELWSDDETVRNTRVTAFRKQMNRVERALAMRTRVGWYGMPGRFWYAPASYDQDWVRNLRIGDVFRSQDVMMPCCYCLKEEPSIGAGSALEYLDHVLTVSTTIARRYQKRFAPIVSFRLFGGIPDNESVVLPDEILVPWWERVMRYQPDDVILWSNESRWGFEAGILRAKLGRQLTADETDKVEAEGIARMNRYLKLLREVAA